MKIAQQLKVTDFPFTIRDKQGTTIYWENSYGDWCKYEFDSNGNPIYIEDSDGHIEDNRPKPKPIKMTKDEISDRLGISVDDFEKLTGIFNKIATTKYY